MNSTEGSNAAKASALSAQNRLMKGTIVIRFLKAIGTINNNYWVALVLLCFAIFMHDPQGTISDDMRGITIMEHIYTSGDFSLRQNSSSKVGINEMAGRDGRIFSASLLGPSLWYYPFFLVGKTFNLVAPLPAGMRPRSNVVQSTPEYEFAMSRNGLGDWAPVFARMGNAFLFPLMYFLLFGLSRLLFSDDRASHLYAIGTLFGTQQLLLNHSNYDHVLNGFGLMLALYSAFRIADKPSKQMGFLCGLGLCISITTRTFSLAYLPLFCLFLLPILIRTRRVAPFVIAGIPIMAGLAINFWYNWIRSGAILTSGYDEKWIQFTSLTNGLFRYLFTIDHSVVLHSPLLLLGIYEAIRSIRSLKWVWVFPISLAFIHTLFYLKWHYQGGVLVPLRFFSEIFFILMLPVCGLVKRRKQLYVFWTLLIIGFFNSVVLSFIDFRRTSPAPASFFTWRSPIIPSPWFSTSADTQIMFSSLKDAWAYGWPDWFGLMVVGWTGAVVALAIFCATAVLCWAQRSSAAKFYKPVETVSLLGSAALAILLIVAVPVAQTDKHISAADVELRNLGVEYHRKNLIMVGDFSARKPMYRAFQIRLTNQALPCLQYCYGDNFKFGADYYNTSIFPPFRTRSDMANFRQTVPLPKHFPPGRYNVEIALPDGEGTAFLDPVDIPNTIEMTRIESFISADQWFLSATCYSKKTTFPITIKPSQTAAISLKLPSGASDRIKFKLFVSPGTGTLELSTSLGDSHKITSPFPGFETYLKVNDDSQPFIILLRCISGEYVFAGASVEPT